MKLDLAQQKDLGRIMELIGQAKEHLKENGVDQWQQGYPDQSSIQQDINNKTGFLCAQGDKMIGYLCIDFNGEPAYDNLKGRWLSSRPYAVVHRLALDNTARGQGLSAKVMGLAEELCLKSHIHSIKIDTDQDNEVMKHILHKNGFQFCGTIWFQNSEKIAYEKLF